MSTVAQRPANRPTGPVSVGRTGFHIVSRGSTRTPGSSVGRVSLVGAGPGDPDLLTVRAWKRIAAADVVLHDALVGDGVLELIPSSTERVFVGKRAGGVGWKQPQITARILAEARLGKHVVRLKGGDPFVFGRGGEEAMALVAAGVPLEVVPGISSAVAAPSAAGIPVTHRGVATHFTVVTGHSADDPELLERRWTHLARAGGTLVFLMPTRNLARIVSALRAAGLSASTPAALVCSSTRDDQHVIDGCLDNIEARMRASGTPTPATLVVGDVVELRERIAVSNVAPGAATSTPRLSLL